MAKTAFPLGLTLYSFTPEYNTIQWSLEDCMWRAGQLGPGTGVEIVGPQHNPYHPNVTQAFINTFRNSAERNGVALTSYGTYSGEWTGRTFTDDEEVEFIAVQLKAASRMGFPLARVQYPLLNVMEKILPYAEKYKVRMVYEIHSPSQITSELAQGLYAQCKRVSSEYLGLCPDAGIFESKGGPGPEGQQWGLESPSKPEDLAGIIDYVWHFHGKFHYMVKGEIPAIPYEGIVRELVKGGYKGYMSTEFESSALGDYPNSFEIVKAHHALLRRYIQKYS
jgi:sugar phosphate isomerase/epimerase